MSCTIMEDIYWHNLTPIDNVSAMSAPVNLRYAYQIPLKGIDAVPQTKWQGIVAQNREGDAFWVKKQKKKNQKKKNPYMDEAHQNLEQVALPT